MYIGGDRANGLNQSIIKKKFCSITVLFMCFWPSGPKESNQGL